MSDTPRSGHCASPIENDAAETVVATRLKLKGWRHLRRFFRINRMVERQLQADPGLVRYRLRADFIRLQFSTMSIWSRDEAIDGFVRTGSHLEALSAFDEIAIREQSAFARWKTLRSQDVTWQECRDRLASFQQASQ